MNKAQLISKIAENVGISKKQAEQALETFTSSVIESLKKGEEVSIAGFGTFLAKKRASRTGINPRTGEKIEIPEITVPKFRAGKALKDALR